MYLVATYPLRVLRLEKLCFIVLKDTDNATREIVITFKIEYNTST